MKLVIIHRNAQYEYGKDIYLSVIDLLISNNFYSMTFFLRNAYFTSYRSSKYTSIRQSTCTVDLKIKHSALMSQRLCWVCYRESKTLLSWVKDSALVSQRLCSRESKTLLSWVKDSAFVSQRLCSRESKTLHSWIKDSAHVSQKTQHMWVKRLCTCESKDSAHVSQKTLHIWVKRLCTCESKDTALVSRDATLKKVF